VAGIDLCNFHSGLVLNALVRGVKSFHHQPFDGTANDHPIDHLDRPLEPRLGNALLLNCPLKIFFRHDLVVSTSSI
jgi:hypothetical protein